MKRCSLLTKVKNELERNGNKLSKEFVDQIADDSYTICQKIGNNTRVCVITLCSGHSLVGYARVIDQMNDVEEIGNRIATEKAKEKLWDLLGALAIAVRNA